MVWWIGLVLIVVMGRVVYNRHFPVSGLKRIPDIEAYSKEYTVLDVRDYNAVKETTKGSLHIPHAYLKRYYKEIPTREVVIIVSDSLLRNVSVRMLKRYGFQIKGYVCIKA
ncbi:hypothetical protein Q73_13175 [Bacillus coahuilensis m2-6]|uniref:Rhodanese domain-containing protein n=1 Tax=Bacillus coahuilensis p1.1.43 TaxID=1150625 RepID=A0A147K4P1_9BACI|nr:hypothetical protein [Bacillus coahuilensis]KUP04406.1 hypothetical protein Q75_15535 [Bacillus coahuilensis p1.1.43]KUP05478.1 hypothetical protein Q73_13175 [Bacillus coahuilensis m2-6]